MKGDIFEAYNILTNKYDSAVSDLLVHENEGIHTALFVSTVHGLTSLASQMTELHMDIISPFWALSVLTNCDHVGPCSTMLCTSVNTFDKYVTTHDQTWPDVTKYGYACMLDAFVSDLWGCQAQITQIHVLKIKS